MLPGKIVPLGTWAVLGLFMLLTRPNIVISHQVANYGMGGQYEPHFDFSRVRPSSPVLSEGPVPAGLRRLGLLEALQPPHQAPPASLGPTLRYWRSPSREPGACRAQCSLAASPGMWGVFFLPIPVILCPSLSFSALTVQQRTSLGLCES